MAPCMVAMAASGVPVAATTLHQFRAKNAEVYSERFGLNSLGNLRRTTSVFTTIDDHEVGKGGLTARDRIECARRYTYRKAEFREQAARGVAFVLRVICYQEAKHC